jgi:hypothetical protein
MLGFSLKDVTYTAMADAQLLTYGKIVSMRQLFGSMSAIVYWLKKLLVKHSRFLYLCRPVILLYCLLLQTPFSYLKISPMPGCKSFASFNIDLKIPTDICKQISVIFRFKFMLSAEENA